MKGNLKNEVSTREQGCVSNSIGSRDYFVTTMQFRKVALSEQQQVKRQRKYLKSATPFQNRNLENFPMPHRREDSIRSAHGQRAERRTRSAQMSRARIDSGSMRDYSKQMFDFSVLSAKLDQSNSVKQNIQQNGKDQGSALYRSKSEVGYRGIPKVNGLSTNGPTPDGSILHNRKQKVLNDIRLRTPRENDADKRRTCSRASLQQTISEKNRKFRVLSLSGDSRRGSMGVNSSINGSDMMFIPVDQFNESSTFMHYFPDNSRQAFASSLSEFLENESVGTHDPFDDNDERSLSISDEFRPVTQSSRPTSCVRAPAMLPPTTACSLRLVSLDEESPSESEEEPEAEVVEEKKPEPPPPPAPKSGSRKGKNAIPEPEPEPEPVKVKLILKGPHCWVDDATVSSDQSDHENLDIPDVEAQPTADEFQPVEIPPEKVDPPKKADSKAMGRRKSAIKKTANEAKTVKNEEVVQIDKDKTEKEAIKTEKDASKEAFENALKCAKTESKEIDKPINDTPVMNSQDVADVNRNETELPAEKEESVQLPPFICPSSEKKSREFALKQWLATNFRSGHKEIPIL